jgi:DNA-binding NarL/FixJ family response regulator
MLTRTEIKILYQISCGKSDKEISNNNSRSLNTIRSHIRNIYWKLKVNNRTKAAIIYHSEIKKISQETKKDAKDDEL